MSEAIRIKCLIRNNFNKRELNILRNNNFFSCSINSKTENLHFYLYAEDFLNNLEIDTSLLNLFFFDNIYYFNNNISLNFIKEKLSYVKNIHKDFLDNKIIHVDFNEINSIDDLAILRVPLKIISNSKDFTLNVNVFQVFHSVLIKCKASKIPSFLYYEIPDNYKKKSISIKDIVIKDETILENENTVFALIKSIK